MRLDASRSRKSIGERTLPIVDDTEDESIFDKSSTKKSSPKKIREKAIKINEQGKPLVEPSQLDETRESGDSTPKKPTLTKKQKSELELI